METLLKTQSKVMVTGACGFIGASLVKMLAESGYGVVGAGRTPPSDELTKYFTHFICCDLNQIELNTKFLDGIDSIINLAGLAHNPRIEGKKAEHAYQETNALMPQRLARAALDAGVSKFIHLSSVKAVGESSPNSRPFDESTPNHEPPAGIYGRSKWEAERLLTSTLNNSKTQLIILRPPLIYGPNAKGTLLQLIRLIALKVPLPLKSSRARRSFISNTNLCTAITSCLDKNNRASGLFFVSDGESISVPNLIEIIATELGFKPLLFSLPESLIKLGFAILRKPDFYEKLFLDLEVKSDEFQKYFSWTPRQSFQQGIHEMVISFSESKRPS